MKADFDLDAPLIDIVPSSASPASYERLTPTLEDFSREPSSNAQAGSSSMQIDSDPGGSSRRASRNRASKTAGKKRIRQLPGFDDPSSVDPVVIDPPSECLIFRPELCQKPSALRTAAPHLKQTVVEAKYTPLPSYDFVTPAWASRPGDPELYDHHPLITWHPEKDWARAEQVELTEFWKEALVASDILALDDPDKDPRTSDPVLVRFLFDERL